MLAGFVQKRANILHVQQHETTVVPQQCFVKGNTRIEQLYGGVSRVLSLRVDMKATVLQRSRS